MVSIPNSSFNSFIRVFSFSQYHLASFPSLLKAVLNKSVSLYFYLQFYGDTAVKLFNA